MEFTQVLRRTSLGDQTVSCLIMSQFASTLLLSARAPQTAGWGRVDFSRRALARSHSAQELHFYAALLDYQCIRRLFCHNADRKNKQFLYVFSDGEF